MPAPLGRVTGVTANLSMTAVNIIASAVLVLPVTGWLPWLESGPRKATHGKHPWGYGPS